MDSYNEFQKDLKRRKLSKITIENYLTALKSIEKFLEKPLDKTITRKDLEGYLDSISDQKPNSIISKIIVLKLYFKWLYKTRKGYPELVDFPLPKKNGNELVSSDLLTEEELLKMINACDNLRDKALVSILYDSACRKSEILGLNIEDVVLETDRTGYIVVSGKTGKRQVPLSFSIPALMNWINTHPLKKDPKAPLFCSLKRTVGDRIFHSLIAYIIKKAKRRAGIKKRVFTHLFRHTRLTELDRKGLSHTAMKHFAGWSKGSNMPSVYSHFSAQDTKDLIYQADGITKQKRKVSLLEPIVCVKCSTPNDNTNRFCYLCGSPLDKDSMKEYEISELLKHLIKSDPSLSRIISEKIKQLKT